MLKERLKSMLLGGAGPALGAATLEEPRIPPGSAIAMGRPSGPSRSRHSPGLEQFFSYLDGQTMLSLLDLSGASQANIDFITALGHRLYSEDFMRTLTNCFGETDFLANQSDHRRVEAFLGQTFERSGRRFHGALVWDSLQYLAPQLLQTTVERLHQAMLPNSYLLAFFHADEKAAAVPAYSYRIENARTLQLTPRGQRTPSQFFNNRGLEKLFQNFQSVKFFLTRDHLREVLAKR